jgi:hypothetical protein
MILVDVIDFAERNARLPSSALRPHREDREHEAVHSLAREAHAPVAELDQMDAFGCVHERRMPPRIACTLRVLHLP